MALLVKPLGARDEPIRVDIRINLLDGSNQAYVGSKNLATSGGLVLVPGINSIPFNIISSI
jgi:hypothetical protein